MYVLLSSFFFKLIPVPNTIHRFRFLSGTGCIKTDPPWFHPKSGPFASLASIGAKF